MTKKILLTSIIIFLMLFTSSCKLNEYIAYVTITNIGDLAILASVDNTEVSINPGEYEVWDIILDDDTPIIVELYAELIEDDSFSDQKTITIAAGEVYPWVVGWEVEEGKFAKKK